jgi:hypothetical protein
VLKFNPIAIVPVEVIGLPEIVIPPLPDAATLVTPLSLGGAAQVPSARRKFVVPPPSLTRPARVVDASCA